MLLPYYYSPLEAGVDEAGRGCLAGPVTAAAVILPKDFKNSLINDSKRLSERQRYALKPLIIEKAIAYAVAHVEPIVIDNINILQASIYAMHKALNQLGVSPNHILVDGNRFIPYKDIPHRCVIKGDSQYMNIAAASILAKTVRDDLMKNLHKKFPHYQWQTNKGYPTKVHRAAIHIHGITSHHRKSFRFLTE